MKEALDSIRASQDISNINYEVIIIDDGSTDECTINFLRELDCSVYLILHQQNKGPASARNTGVRASKAAHLLFLDSDNILKEEFIVTGLKLLKETDADIIYGNPEFFGDATRKVFTPGPFNLNMILLSNYIDMCSMIRKTVWDETGGFDEAPVLIGFEDWEFWIRAGAEGYKFKFLNKALYYYRINDNSLLAQKNVKDNYDKVVDYVYDKHFKKVQRAYRGLYTEYLICKRDQTLPLRSFFKFSYIKYIKPFFDLEKRGFRNYKQQL